MCVPDQAIVVNWHRYFIAEYHHLDCVNDAIEP